MEKKSSIPSAKFIVWRSTAISGAGPDNTYPSASQGLCALSLAG